MFGLTERFVSNYFADKYCRWLLGLLTFAIPAGIAGFAMVSALLTELDTTSHRAEILKLLKVFYIGIIAYSSTLIIQVGILFFLGFLPSKITLPVAAVGNRLLEPCLEEIRLPWDGDPSKCKYNC